MIDEVKKITDISDVKFESNPDLIEMIGEEVDNLYIEHIKSFHCHQKLFSDKKILKLYTHLFMVPELNSSRWL